MNFKDFFPSHVSMIFANHLVPCCDILNTLVDQMPQKRHCSKQDIFEVRSTNGLNFFIMFCRDSIVLTFSRWENKLKKCLTFLSFLALWYGKIDKLYENVVLKDVKLHLCWCLSYFSKSSSLGFVLEITGLLCELLTIILAHVLFW